MNLSFELSDADLDALAARLSERIPQIEEGSPWLTLKPAAEYLGTTPAALRKAAQRGQIPHHQPSGERGRLYFARKDLDAWVSGEG
jgi:excisionase family DNA binding protein